MRRHTISAGVIGATVLALAGCGSVELSRLNPWADAPEQSRIPRDATAYDCAAGKKLLVRFLGGGKSVVIVLPEREFRLDQVSAAPGVSYSNGRATLVTQGDEAVLEEGKEMQFTGCKKSSG